MLSINAIGNVNFVSRPAFKATKKLDPQENFEDVNLQGIDALASYNTTLLNNLKILDVTPLPLIHNPEEKFEGEEIYTSKGELYSITKDMGGAKFIFKPAEDEDELDTITVVDKKSGKILSKQLDSKDEDAVISRVYEYSPINGKELKYTRYEDGEAVYAQKHIMSHGKDEYVNYDIKNKTYCIDKEGKNFYSSVDFNQDKVLTAFWQEKTRGLNTQTISANLYNGAILSLEKTEKTTMPNNINVEALKDSRLNPAPRFEIERDYKGLEGEKTYYSNGALETNNINNGEAIAHFTPDGNLVQLELENKTIKYAPNSVQEIEEHLDDGTVKTTSRCKDEGVCVKIEKDNFTKELCLSAQNKPTYYSEKEVDEKGDFVKYSSFSFNEFGMLKDAYIDD